VTREDPWIEIYENRFSDGTAEGWSLPSCASDGCAYLQGTSWYLPAWWHLLQTTDLGFVAEEDWAVEFQVTMNNWYELGVYPDTESACRTGCSSFYVYANNDTMVVSADGSEATSAEVYLDSLNSFGPLTLRVESTDGETCVQADRQELVCASGRAVAPGRLLLHLSHGPGNLYSFKTEGRESVYGD